MKKFLFTLLLVSAALSANSQNIFSCTNGEVSFFSKAPVEDIDALSKSMSSVLNVATGEIVFVVPIASFKFRKPLMQEHFNEKYMESDKYPNATYEGKITEKIELDKDGEYEINSTGTLNMHNVEKPRCDKGKLVIKDGKIFIQCEFNVLLKEHKIKVPKFLFNNIAETIKVNFTAAYSITKKEN